MLEKNYVITKVDVEKIKVDVEKIIGEHCS
jgi:hypothetical protein